MSVTTSTRDKIPEPRSLGIDNQVLLMQLGPPERPEGEPAPGLQRSMTWIMDNQGVVNAMVSGLTKDR